MGHGDIAPSTVIHIPAIDTVVARGVVCNQTHAMRAFGGPQEWERWIQSVDTIEELSPKTIVADHKCRIPPIWRRVGCWTRLAAISEISQMARAYRLRCERTGRADDCEVPEFATRGLFISRRMLAFPSRRVNVQNDGSAGVTESVREPPGQTG